jgi:hypothetical protein
MHKVQIVDREKDRHIEEVIDSESGKIVRRCEEPSVSVRGTTAPSGANKFKATPVIGLAEDDDSVTSP